MVKFHPILLVVAGLLFFSLPLRSQSWVASEYAGYRCAILQVSDVSVKGDKVRFTCSLANTGKEDLRFDPERPSGQVVFTGDPSFHQSGLASEQDLVALGLMRSGLKIRAGEIISGQKVILDREKDGMPLPVVPAPDKPSEGGVSASGQKTYAEIKEDGCPDLIIDSLWVVGEKRNSMQLMIRLRNQGDGPAHLYTADRQDKGMGISFYFGTSGRISRGSMFIQGEHIDDGLNDEKGKLMPGKTMIKAVSLDTSRHNRFLTALQCRVDTFQRIVECDETNNEFTYFLR